MEERKEEEWKRESNSIWVFKFALFLQACRGTKQTASVDVVTTRRDNVQYTEQYKLPMDADTLVLHSTYDGKFAYRWVINTLSNEI